MGLHDDEQLMAVSLLIMFSSAVAQTPALKICAR